VGPRAKVYQSWKPNYLPRPIIEPDVDNYPFNFQYCRNANDVANNPACGFGPEDLDRNGNGIFNPGDAVSFTWTDSFDDNLPTECPASQAQVLAGTADGTQDPFLAHPGTALEYDAGSCFDGLRPFNQVQPGVFDGGWAFEDYRPGGAAKDGAFGHVPLIGGDYIVQMMVPPGFEDMRAQSRNVDFGESFGGFDDEGIGTAALPAECVGPKYLVPAELDLFPGVTGPLAGQWMPSCEMKHLTLSTGASGGGFNAAADFFLFTEVPKAARGVGAILDDLANQFDPTNPAFGEKHAPPFIPVSVRDYTGREIARTYSDEFGGYNFLAPSTYSVNVPSPSGVSPNMLEVCLNDPVKPDGTFDTAFQRNYGQVCYTLQFMPGSTTYLDTPVLPISAFASNTEFPLDCECMDGTPVIYSVDSAGGTGPVLVAGGAEALTLISMGDTDVPNPSYDNNVEPITITRDFGFGDVVGEVFIGGVAQTVTSWSNDMITIDVAAATPAAGDLSVVRADNGMSTKQGVRISRGVAPGTVHVVTPLETIQGAIDAATAGDVIVVMPGEYNEALILHRNVRLQGSGAPSTVINARVSPGSLLGDWQQRIADMDFAGDIDLLPTQTYTSITDVLVTEVTAALSVFGRELDTDYSMSGADGFTLTGGDNGGGVLINAYVSGFELSNNVIGYNQGTYAGGVRVGAPDPGVDPLNDNVNIHHNRIVNNGGGGGVILDGAGGVALFAGADNYVVANNDICGNLSQGNGAGVGHVGLSDGGVIRDNTIRFNESFNQAETAHGGGIYISGRSALVDPVLSDGAGNLVIEGNVLQGNNAGAGDGGAIATEGFNGVDAFPFGVPTYELRIVNNTLVNNVTGGAGTIRLGDVVNSFIAHNTIALNDSTATASSAFAGGDFSQSVAQVSGIYALRHSADLLGVLGIADGFADPVLVNNIIWRNRSCIWMDDIDPGTAGNQQGIDCSDGFGGESFDELGVQGGGCLSATNSVLTDPLDACDPLTNTDGDPEFIDESIITTLSSGGFFAEAPNVEAFAAFDEGGNFIDVRYGVASASQPDGQLMSKGDFHIGEFSPARYLGAAISVFDDIDGDIRPFGAAADAGSDENVDGPSASTIGILRAEVFQTTPQPRVRVWATSAYGANADLTLTFESDNRNQPWSWPMVYNASKGRWQKNFNLLPEDFPITLTVSGPEGSVVTVIADLP